MMFRVFWLYLEKGGMVNFCIFFGCCLIMFIGMGKYFHFRRVLHARSPQELYRSAAGARAHQLPSGLSMAAGMSRNTLREVLLVCIPRLERGLDTMAVLVTVSPLLGLLGTVIGMIQTFMVIMLYGVGNPGLLSEGISVALLTTQAGLIVSFPGLLFHNFLTARKEELVHRMITEGERLVHSA